MQESMPVIFLRAIFKFHKSFWVEFLWKTEIRLIVLANFSLCLKTNILAIQTRKLRVNSLHIQLLLQKDVTRFTDSYLEVKVVCKVLITNIQSASVYLSKDKLQFMMSSSSIPVLLLNKARKSRTFNFILLIFKN